MSEPESGQDTPGRTPPGTPFQKSREPGGDYDDVEPGLVTPQDLGSASRSCLAIIVVLIVILLLLCVFFVGQQVT